MATLWFSAPALAQDPSVKDLYNNGQVHYDSGQYDLAIEAWAEAHRRSGRPILLMKMADACEAGGKHAQAVELLEKYRDEADESEVEGIDQRIEQLRALVSAPPVEPDPDPPPDPNPVVDPVVADLPDPPAEASSEGPLPSVLLGAGVLGLGTGVGFGLRAQAARAEAKGFCVGPDDDLMCSDEAQPALKRDRSSSTVADVGFIVGGAASVAFVSVQLVSGGPVVQLSPRQVALHWTIR